MWGYLALAALTALRLAAAAVTPLSPDEAYYWVWSRHLAAGYLDHPPMVALWIRAGTLLAGDGNLGIRLLGPLAAALGSVLLALAAEDCFPGRRVGVIAAALFNATLLLGAGALLMTPDTPLLLFWTAAVWALARLLRTGNGAWWLAAGLAAGLAMASKYTGVLLVGGMLAWIVVTPGARVWLRRPALWGGVALGALAFLPVVLWNATHGWASFARQGGRTGDWHPARAAQFLGELLAGQIGLATPLVFLTCVGGIAVATRRTPRDPVASMLAVLTLLPAAVFVQHALGDRVQGNWPAILYPTAIIAAAGYGARLWRPAVVLGLAITAVVTVQAASGLLPVPAGLDPTQRQLAGWPALAAAAARMAQQGDRPAAFVAADEYGLAAELARNLPHTEVVGAEPRWALFGLPAAEIAGRTGLLLRTARRSGVPDPAPWRSIEPAGEIDRPGSAGTVERYLVYRVVGGMASAAVVALPQPTNAGE